MFIIGWDVTSQVRNHREYVRVQAATAVEQSKYDSEAKACIAGQNEICPSAQWLEEYDEWQNTANAIAAKIHDDQLRWYGEQHELQTSAPAGAQFDATKRKFVKSLAANLAPPATPPTTPAKK
jgi:hypothetical protein